MPIYLESSALIKAYVPERGSARVQEIVRRHDVIISLLTVAEVASAFARRVREGELRADLAEELFQAFMDDVAEFEIVPLSDSLVLSAARVLLPGGSASRLRALDAIHLVTAREAAEAHAETLTLVSADKRLVEAAESGGLSVENPEAVA